LVLSASPIEHPAVAAILTSEISPASALSFIFAVFYSVPCLGSIGAVWSETKSWRWALWAVGYYLGTTLLAGFLAYRIGLLLY
jgi:ferrous iron transport protein B